MRCSLRDRAPHASDIKRRRNQAPAGRLAQAGEAQGYYPKLAFTSLDWPLNSLTPTSSVRDAVGIGWSPYADVDAGLPGTPGAGAGGQVVTYTLTYRQPFMTGGLAAILMGAPHIDHQATIVIKNEPFLDAPC